MESRLIPLHSAGLFNARVCERERICVCELVARIELPGQMASRSSTKDPAHKITPSPVGVRG